MLISFHTILDTKNYFFRDILSIYRHSFPENQRLSEEMISQRLEKKLHQLIAGFWEEQVVSMAVLHPLRHNFILLEYFAIHKDFRGQAIGTKFIQHILTDCASANKFLILEVEDPDWANEQEIKARRVEFYKRLGAKEMKGVNYILPPLTGNIPTQDKLLIMGGYPENTISGELVKKLIKQLYGEVYLRDEQDKYLNLFIHDIPDVIELI